MDIREMNLLEELKDNPEKTVKATSSSSYLLGEERVSMVAEQAKKMLSMSFWDPEYQAWLPFISSYLRSGANPKLAQDILPELAVTDTLFVPPKSYCDNIMKQWESLGQRQPKGRGMPFSDIQYSEVLDFCKVVEFLAKNLSFISRALADGNDFAGVVQQLQKEAVDGTLPVWDSQAIRMYLWNHQANAIVDWPNLEEEQEAVKVWKQRYSQCFEEVQRLFEDKLSLFPWYNEAVKNTILAVWDRGFKPHSTEPYVSPAAMHATALYLTNRIIAEATTQPSSYSIDWKPPRIISSLYITCVAAGSQKFQTKELWFPYTIELKLVEKAIEEACEFVLAVKNQTFVPLLIQHKKLQLQLMDVRETEDEFITKLAVNGYPV